MSRAITITIGLLFLSCPALPALELQIQRTGPGQARLTWDAVAGATTYKVFRADQLDPPGWTEVATAPDLFYELATTNAKSFYRIRAITNAPSPLVFVQGGTFNNGVSTVTLSDFWIDRYEVTQSSFAAVMGWSPGTNYGGGPNYPVYYVSWFRAVEYCNRRSLLEGLAPCYTYSGHGTNPDDWPYQWWLVSWNAASISCSWSAAGYRLPTEMEWMFAALGGTYTHYYMYSGSDDLNAVAWWQGNSGYLAHEVGTKAPNELGLYDMTGSVLEWVWDSEGALPTEPTTNPTGPAPNAFRMYRGGSYRSLWQACTVSYRGSAAADSGYNNIALRVVRISL